LLAGLGSSLSFHDDFILPAHTGDWRGRALAASERVMQHRLV
jgi:hypothetical protein